MAAMNHGAIAGRQAAIWAAALLTGVGLAGCGSVETPAPKKPAMPTIAERPAVAPATLAPQERLAAARRAVEAGDFSRAVEALNGISGEERVRVTRGLAGELAAREPARAAGFASALLPGRARAEALEVAARAWGKSDGEKALRWAMEFADPADGTVTRRAVAGEMVAANALGAIERLLALAPEARRDETLGFAAAAWARREPERAVEWVRGFDRTHLSGPPLMRVRAR